MKTFFIDQSSSKDVHEARKGTEDYNRELHLRVIARRDYISSTAGLPIPSGLNPLSKSYPSTSTDTNAAREYARKTD
jgi:hypothetical protein